MDADSTPGRSRASAYALLPLVIVLWGMNWPLLKIGLAYITPLWLATIRVGLGSLCLFAYLAVTRQAAIPTRQDLPIVASVAIFQMALFLPLSNFGLRHVPAGRAAVLVYTTPLWVAPGAVVFLGEQLGRQKLAGLVCGLCGVLLLFNPFALDWTNRDVVVGSFSLMLASMSWGVSLLHIRAHRWHLSVLQLTPWQLVMAFVLLLPLTLVLDDVHGIHWNATLAGVLFYNGPITTAFCFWAATSISQALPAITTSLSFLGVPVVGLAASQLVLGETPDPSLLAGFALILVGVTLVNLADWFADEPSAVRDASGKSCLSFHEP